MLVLLAGLLGCGSRQDEWYVSSGARQVWVGEQRVLKHPYPLWNRWFYAPPRGEGLPTPLCALHPMWRDGTAWILGVPGHPGLDLIEARYHRSYLTWFLGGIGSSRTNPLWQSVPQILYRKAPGEAWHRAGQYHPEQEAHGLPTNFEALGDGSFLALSRQDWFRDGDLASPCARYCLDANGELRFQGLLELMEGVALPPRKPEGGDAPGSPWLPWQGELDWASSPRAVVIASRFGGCLSLLDPWDGHLLRHVRLPDPGQRTFSLRVQPAPDGAFLVTAARSTALAEVVRTPGGDLAAARLGLIAEDVEVQPVAFRLDPGSGVLAPQALPPGTPALLSHAEYNSSFVFLVDAQGQLELHRRRMQ
jgi:hypothetical protein